jgi:polyphosphate kinase 2 (PPK2 family)
MGESGDSAKQWLEDELEDNLAEEYELELSDTPVAEEIGRISKKDRPKTLDNKEYFHHLLALQSELIKLQTWVGHTGAKIMVPFEGRDSAGKGGVIKRIT